MKYDNLTEQQYNCLDCVATSLIFNEMKIEDSGKSGALFDTACMGPALTMQLRGMRVDRKAIKLAKQETEEKAVELQKRFVEIVGPWKWAKGLKPAPTSFSKLLYTKMGVKPHFNRDGGFTIDKEAVSKILEDPKTPEEAWEAVSIAQQLEILEEDRKVLEKPISKDGRMHCSYTVTGTSTGRWSSRKNHFDEGANLHALSKHLHKIFIADDGWVMVNIDQKQGESKIVAYLAGSPSYKEAHSKGNLHVNTGKLVFPGIVTDTASAKNTPLPWDKGKTYYDGAKKVSHSSNYLQTPWGMARQLRIKVSLAEEYQGRYFGGFPEIQQWHEEIKNQVRVYKYLTTPFGRVRHFLGRTWESSLFREAVAHVPQSTCSQINKIVLWRIWNDFDNQRAMILHENHDSVLFQVREGDAATLQEIEQRVKLDVPIRGDVLQPVYEFNWGHNWNEKEMKLWEGKF